MGWAKPLFIGVDPETGKTVLGVDADTFQRINEGYGCGVCGELWELWRPRCPVCRTPNEPDVVDVAPWDRTGTSQSRA